MAEAKRIELTTVGSLKKDRKPRESRPTRRFNLKLCESNEQKCPEFSYSQLLKSCENEEKKESKNGVSDPLDPFGDDDAEDEKMKNLARKFEEKYAPIPSKKPGKKAGRMEDYIDLGMGYDETDPFIDNTDAYDELVPSTLTTQYGGFYINSGKLDFKELQSESTEDDVEDMSRKRKKRRLKDVEKESFRRKKKFKEVRDAPDMQQPKKRGRKPVDKSDGAFLKPRKKQPTVAVLLQHHKAQLQQLHVPHQQRDSSSANSSKQPRNSTPLSAASQLAANSLTQQLPASIVADIAALAAARLGVVDPPKLDASINDIIESVIIGAQDRDNSNGEFDPTRFLDTTSSSSGGDHSGEHPQYPVDGGGIPRLPDGLPEDLDRKLALVKAAALRSAEGKCKFFSGEVNGLLLKIELLSRELSCSHRSRVYSHLASHLPCTKETLLKRVKKLRMDSEDCKIRGPTHKLKEAIDEVMSVLEPEYEARLKSVMLKGIRLAELSSSDDEDYIGGNEEYDEDEDYDSGLDEEDFEGNRRLIRKKFKWNDKVRRYLCDVVDLKLKCYEVSKSRTQSAYTYLRTFLAVHIKPFWPRGWIRTRKLIIESRVVHAHLTRRPKKSVVTVKKFCLPAVSLLPSPNQSSARLAALESPVTVDTSSPGTLRSSQPLSSPLPSPLASPVVMGTCTPPTSRGSPVDYRAAAALLQSSTKAAGPMIGVPSSRSSRLTTSSSVISTPNSYGLSNSTSPAATAFHSHSKSVLANAAGSDADGKLASNSSRTFSIFDSVGYKAMSRVGSPHATDTGGSSSRRHHQTSHMSPLVAASLSPMTAPSSPATASDVLSEIINASLANFPNSDNHVLKPCAGGDLRYRESPKFSPIFGSKSGSQTSGGNVKVKSEPSTSTGGVIVDAVRTAFAVPKSVLNLQKAMANSMAASSKSGDLHSGGGVVVSSAQSSPSVSSAASSLLLLKDSDRHVLGSGSRATAQDLRIQSRSSSHHSGGGGSLGLPHHHNRRTPSPVRNKDWFGSTELTSLGAKLAAASAAAPFHTSYDMQGAIERSLRGGGGGGKSSPPRVHSLPTTVASLASKLQQHQSRSSASMGYYAPAVSSPSPTPAASDQPLNFSTSRQPASVSDRMGGGSSSRSSVAPSSSSSVAHHHRQRSMASTTNALSSTTSTSVRTVSLPQSHSAVGAAVSVGSRKYAGGSSMMSSRGVVKPDQGFQLEGIAASWHELHMKKVQRTMDPTSSGSVRSPGVVVGHSEVGSSSGGGSSQSSQHHHHHQSGNHELPKVSTSSYPEAVAHLMAQGGTDLRLHKPRVPRPPALQGNPGSP